jgi:hypothetical protein
MNLASEIGQLIERCVNGELSTGQLDRELSAYVRRIAAARDDQGARRLYGQARILATEVGYGHRTEASARRALRAVLRQRSATQPASVSTPCF